MKKCHAVCLGCCLVSTLIVVIAVLCVYFFAMGKIAQDALDDAQLVLTNNTQMPCTKTQQFELINVGQIKTSSPVSTQVHEYTTYLSAWLCPGGADATTCDRQNVTKTALGHFTAPAMKMKKGWNDLNQEVTMFLHDTNVETYLITGILYPVLYQNKKVWITIESDDVSVTVLGRKLHGLHMSFDLTCKSEGQPVPGRGSPAHCPGDTETDQNQLALSMSCVMGQHALESDQVANLVTSELVV